MNIPELMAILCAKNNKYEHGSRGVRSSGADDLSAAIGMAKIPKAHYCLLRVKYCDPGDLQQSLNLRNHIFKFAVSESIRLNWGRSSNYRKLWGLSQLVRDEIIGRNVDKLTHEEKAKVLSVCRSTYIRKWDRRIHDIVNEIKQWEIEAVAKIGSKLF